MKLRLPLLLITATLTALGGQNLVAAPITSTITSDTTLDSNTPVNIVDDHGISNPETSTTPLVVTIDGQAQINVSGTTKSIDGIRQYRAGSSLSVIGADNNSTLNIVLTPGSGDVTGIFAQGAGNPHITNIDVKTSITINDGGTPISNAIGIWGWDSPVTLKKETTISVTAHGIKGRLWGVGATAATVKFENDLSITVNGTLNNAFYASGINSHLGGTIELNGATHIVVNEDGAGNSGLFLGMSSVFDGSVININGPIDITVTSATPENAGGMLAQGGSINSLSQTVISTLPGGLAIEAATDSGVAGIVHISRHADIDDLTKTEAVAGAITGKISVDDSTSTVHLNLTGKLSDGGISFYQGATSNKEGTFNLGLHDGAEWRVMDEADENGSINSTVTNLTLSSQSVIDLATYAGQGNPGNTFRTLSLANTNVNIDGSMVLRINTDLANGTGDKLVFADGYNASGQTISLEIMHDAGINKLGDKVTAMDGQELEVVQNFNGGSILAEGNSYTYDAALQQGSLKVTTTAEGKIQELELVAPVDPNPPIDPNPPVSTPVATASDDVAALRGLVLFTAPEMTRHLTDLQAQAPSMRKDSLWFLGRGGRANADSISHVSRGFDQDLYGFQLGGDFILGKGESVVGGFIEHAQADNSYNRGSGKTKGSGFGLYSSWMPGNSYINIAAKVQRLDSEYNSVNLQNLSVSGDYDTWAYSAAIEAGHKFMLPESPLWIEPQAGLTLTHIENFTYTNSQNTNIHSSSINSALAHAGVAMGWNIAERSSLYVKASVLHDMGSNGRLYASIDGSGITVPMYDMTDTWGEFTLGLNTSLSDCIRFFSSVSTTTGGNYNLDWSVTAGISYSF